MIKSTQSHLGFTLIELLLTLAIAGIVMGIAVPSMQSIISSNRLTTQANSMVGALNIARSESIKRSQYVTVGKLGNTWESGWQVFVDKNKNGSFDAATDTVIQTYESITANTMNTSFTNYISYRPDGRSNTIGSFYFCSPTALAAFRRVVIANSGRIRTETQDTSTKTYTNEC